MTDCSNAHFMCLIVSFCCLICIRDILKGFYGLRVLGDQSGIGGLLHRLLHEKGFTTDLKQHNKCPRPPLFRPRAVN
jgi:hypothetical protein